MKVIIYMGVSLNGYVAREDGDSEWTSEENLKGFIEKSKETGNIVIGKNTFLYASKAGLLPFKNALNVVVSREDLVHDFGADVMVTDKSPAEIILMMEAKGFTQVFVGGGGALNASFLKANLVDEIYADIEPIVLGRGIKFFAEFENSFELELINCRKLNADTVQLHYRVIKSHV